MKQKGLLSKTIVLLWCLSLFSFGLAHAKNNKAGTKPKAPQLKLAGVTAIPNLSQTLQRLSRYQSKQIPYATRRALQRIIWSIRMFLPRSNVNASNFIKELPKLLSKLGIKTNKSVGLSLWYQGRSIFPVLSVSLELKKLKPLTQKMGIKILKASLEKNVYAISIQARRSKPRWLGIMVGEQFHAPLIATGPLKPGLHNAKTAKQALTGLLKRHGDLLSHALNKSLHSRTAAQLKRQDIDWLVSVPSLDFFQSFNPQEHKQLGKFLKRADLSVSFKTGLKASLNSDMLNSILPLLSVMKPQLPTQNWPNIVPASVGWMGQFHINTKTLLNFPDHLLKSKLIKTKEHTRMNKGWKKIQKGLLKEGIDIIRLLKNMSGEYVSGFLWDKGMVKRLPLWKKNRGFRGHMKGVFAMAGFRTKQAALQSITDLTKTAQKMFPNPKGKQESTIKVLKIQGAHCLQIKVRRVAPFYLAVLGQNVLFAGHKDTLDAFLAVHHKKASAASTLFKTNPALKTLLSHKGNYFFVLPKVLRQVTGILMSKKEQSYLEKAVRSLRLISTYTVTKGTHSYGSISLDLANKALFKGPLPSIPKPKVNPVHKELKTMIRAISNGAIAWYDSEHTDKNGDPVARHFPCRGKGWLCTPKAKPCSKGKPQYAANSGRWNKQCWRQLKFAITKAHFGRYCIRSVGQGSKSRFEITAQLQPICSQKTRIHKMHIHIANNGEAMRSLVTPRIGPKPPKPPKLPSGPSLIPAVGASFYTVAFASPILGGMVSAVAIPSYLKFIRKSKTSEASLNIKAIADGATAWFDAEHADQNGNPIPKQFPCRGKGWICTPKANPCHKGRALYSRNPNRWNHKCWRALKFGINKQHYFKYCYRATGIGTKSKFEIKAIGDLDCDTKTSLWTVKGHVDWRTGEVNRSNLVIRDGLE